MAGRYAVALFLVGTLSAGLSSVFPICMVAPLLISDYRKGEFDSRSKLFRILCGIACVLGLAVPVFGANPVAAQIATQVSQVFVLPLVISGVAVKGLTGVFRANSDSEQRTTESKHEQHETLDQPGNTGRQPPCASR